MSILTIKDGQNPLQEYIYIYQISLIIKWRSIRANVSILFNQMTLIIKWMSILANPLSRILKILLSEYSHEC
jgi:hypothetical protein